MPPRLCSASAAHGRRQVQFRVGWPASKRYRLTAKNRAASAGASPSAQQLGCAPPSSPTASTPCPVWTPCLSSAAVAGPSPFRPSSLSARRPSTASSLALPRSPSAQRWTAPPIRSTGTVSPPSSSSSSSTSSSSGRCRSHCRWPCRISCARRPTTLASPPTTAARARPPAATRPARPPPPPSQRRVAGDGGSGPGLGSSVRPWRAS
jgi:hypothetical protein